MWGWQTNPNRCYRRLKNHFGRICLVKNLQLSVGCNGLVTVHMDMPRRRLIQQMAQPFLISSVIGAAVEGISEKSEQV